MNKRDKQTTAPQSNNSSNNNNKRFPFTDQYLGKLWWEVTLIENIACSFMAEMYPLGNWDNGEFLLWQQARCKG